MDTGNSVISEFYTPMVPKGHDFLEEIGKLAAACGAALPTKEILEIKQQEKECLLDENDV